MASYEKVISGLLAATHRIHPESIVSIFAEYLPQLGMEDVALYLADMEQRLLVAAPGQDQAVVETLPIDGSLAGEAFRSESITAEPVPDSPDPATTVLWVPLVDGAERLGVLRVTVADSAQARSRASDAATIAAGMVVSKAPYGDALVVARRRKEMDVAAELRWDSLPPLTYVNDRVEISGLLEPAYDIAGDAFDYAINSTLAHVAIFDAMGHGLEASRVANLATAAYRNARRRLAGPQDIFAFVDRTVATAFGSEVFVTGQLAVLDTATGYLELINAGHPPPILVRDSNASELPCRPCLPFGLGGTPTTTGDIALEHDDLVLFFTDGVTEARSVHGSQFGRERLERLLLEAVGAGPLAETVRRLCHAVLEHQDGRLQDDATFLLIKWTGKAPPPD